MRLLCSFSVILTLLLLSSCTQSGNPSPDSQATTLPISRDTTETRKIHRQAVELINRNPDSSIALLLPVVNDERGDSLIRIEAYRTLGYAYTKKGNYYQSTSLFNKGLVMARSINPNADSRPLINMLNTIGASYGNQGKYDSASIYFYDALKQYETDPGTTPIETVASILKNLMVTWDKLDVDGTNSRQYLGKIEEFSKRFKDNYIIQSGIASSKGIFFGNRKQYDSASYYLNIALQIGRKHLTGNFFEEQNILNALASVYIDANRITEAKTEVEEALKISKERNDLETSVNASFTLGNVYYLLKNYKKAIHILETSLNTAKTAGINLYTSDAYHILADSYSATGNYKKALENQQAYTIIRDSLLKRDKIEAVNQLEVKNQIAVKNEQITKQQLNLESAEHKNRIKNIWIGSITIFALLAVLVSILLYRSNRHKQKLQQQEVKNLHQKMEIDRLQAVLSGEEKERSRLARELHDGIGGLLGSARMQLGQVFKERRIINDKEIARATELLEEASAELRKTAHNLMPEILLNEGLIHATALFCERAANGHTLQISFEAIGELPPLPAETQLALYRIIQELVHNIIKHANAATALVQIAYLDDCLGITVEDDGKGIQDKSTKTTGMGLTVIKERATAMHGNMHINGGPGKGTSIHLEFRNIEMTTNKQHVN